jgi:phospholipid/cholesterol/gamma-HCH transport system ATP-binding protein
MPETLYEIRGLTKKYGDRVILDDLDFDIYKGECLVILGRSGTGKSVTLRQLNGLEKPEAGTVVFDGTDLTRLDERELFPIRRRIAMLFQSGALFDSMTVFENVAFPLREHTDMSDDEITRAVRERLELVNLPNTEHLMPVDLSGGMRKRVGLARSIVLDPKVILYDEPTTGLDPITAQTINELIVDLQAKLNVTSVVVTHDIHSAFSVGDRIAFLNQGVFEWVGSMDEARDSDHPKLREFLKASAVVAAQPTKM